MFLCLGYLAQACRLLKENIDNMPGDSRTLIGFITFSSSIHFYSLKVRVALCIMMNYKNLIEIIS